MQEEAKQVYGALSVYRERGYYLRRLENFQQAILSHDEAFNNAPENVRNLLGRSRVCIEAFRPEQAFADAQLALSLMPDSMQARQLQARALYTMTEFERSIVLNYRGLLLRKQPPYFKESINQGLETIQNCIGVHAGKVMLDLLPEIKHQETLRNKRSNVRKSLHQCRIPQENTGKELTLTEAKQHLTLARVIAMKYLGAMASDKFFLEGLLEDRRIKSANSKGSSEILKFVKQALSALTEQQELLRTQRPYYTVKLAEKTASKYQNKFKKIMFENERSISSRMAEKLIQDIEKCTKKKNLMEILIKAERFQIFLDGKTEKILPEKHVYLDRLYKAVGEAYLSQHRLSYTLSDKSNRRRIAFLMGMSIPRATSHDSVLMNQRNRAIDKNLAIEKLKITLDMCENPYMKCWILYELSKLLLTQRSYSLGKFYAKRCQAEAHHIGSVAWWLNGCFALMSGDMQQGNSGEVCIAIEQAYEWSSKMQDPEHVQAFLRKCAQMASETVKPDDRKIISLRERNILSVMHEDQRIETEVLFKRMSTVPPGRRFSVLPIKMGKSDDKPERHRRKQKGLTVIPGAVKTLPALD